MLCPKLMLLGVALISKLMPADFVWSRVDKAVDPLLFLTSQLCFLPCICCSSTWTCREKVLPFLLALFLCYNCKVCSAWPCKEGNLGFFTMEKKYQQEGWPKNLECVLVPSTQSYVFSLNKGHTLKHIGFL